MISDKQIFYNMLERWIDNFLGYSSPFGMFSGLIKDYIFKKIKPYVEIFFAEDAPFDQKIDCAADFIESEVKNKIEDFKKQLKEKIQDEKII